MPSLVEIGPVVLEKKLKVWKVYRRTDRRQTTGDQKSSSGELKMSRQQIGSRISSWTDIIIDWLVIYSLVPTPAGPCSKIMVWGHNANREHKHAGSDDSWRLCLVSINHAGPYVWFPYITALLLMIKQILIFHLT